MKDQKIIEARQMLCRYLSNVAREKGITLTEIAEKTGFKQPNVHRMLSGRYPPTLDNFIILADAIGVYFFVIDKEDQDNSLVKMMKKRWGEMHEN